LPASLNVLGTGAELGTNEIASSFGIEYLSESSLSEDAQALLAGLLERKMGLNAGSLRFTHVPVRHDFSLNSKMEVPENE
jgi:hypothetical protein